MTLDQGSLVTRASLFVRLLDPESSEAAWREFVARYRPLIVGWCRGKNLQESDAEDVCQTVLCNLVRGLKKRTIEYDPSRKFRHYLRRAVENAIRDSWSDLAKRPGARGSGDSAVAGVLAQLQDPADLVREVSTQLELDSLVAVAVKQVRAKVAPHTWEAYWQTAFEGLRAEEAAAQLGRPVATVYQARHRVNEMLKEALRELQARAADDEGGVS